MKAGWSGTYSGTSPKEEALKASWMMPIAAVGRLMPELDAAQDESPAAIRTGVKRRP